MRHRFVLSLYSDVEDEAVIADYLVSLPKSRRPEFVRMLAKAGFKALMQGADSKPSSATSSAKRNPNNQGKVSKEGGDNPPTKDKKATDGDKPSPIKRDPDHSHGIGSEGESYPNKSDRAGERSDKSDTKVDEDEIEDPTLRINSLLDGV